MWHASKPNETSTRRVGLALRYITPEARQERVDTDFAILLRGDDRYGHFQAETHPAETIHADAVAEHQRITDIQGQIYLKGTDRAGGIGLVETNGAESKLLTVISKAQSVIRNDDQTKWFARYFTVSPESTGKTCPVTRRDSSEAR